MASTEPGSPHLLRRIDSIDFYRGVAILLVFLCHLISFSVKPADEGWEADAHILLKPHLLLFFLLSYGRFGVPLFFVISGLCIHLSHAHEKERWNAMLVKRFFRIYPPYALSVVVVMFIGVILASIKHIPLGGPLSVENFLAHLLLMHNFFDRWVLSVNGPWWSLAVEAQLYLLYPILFSMAQLASWKKALLVVGGIEVSLRIIFFLWPNFSHQTPPAAFVYCPLMYWFSWSIGAYLGQRYLSHRPWIPSQVTTAALFLLFVALSVLPLAAFYFLGFAILSALFLARSIFTHSDIGQSNPVTRHIAFAGMRSYSFYLWHLPILGWFNGLVTRFSWWPSLDPHVHLLFFGSLWFVILGLAHLSYQYVEKPSIEFGKKILLSR